MKYLFAIALLCLVGSIGYGQSYEEMVGKAAMFYKQKKYLLSAKIYQKAFQEKKDQATDVFTAAKAWAMVDGQHEEAFSLLKLCIDNGWVTAAQLQEEKAFNKIRDMEEWAVLKSRIAFQAKLQATPQDTTGN